MYIIKSRNTLDNKSKFKTLELYQGEVILFGSPDQAYTFIMNNYEYPCDDLDFIVEWVDDKDIEEYIHAH